MTAATLVHKQSAAGGESLLFYDEKGSLTSWTMVLVPVTNIITWER